MFDIKKIKDEAVKEVTEERATKAKEQLKNKILQLQAAKQVVSNIERELEDLELELKQTL